MSAALAAANTGPLDRFYSGLAPVDPADIAAVDGIIFAAARAVQGRERFIGKARVDVGVERRAALDQRT